MKLKVKPDGREGVWLAEKADLKAFIKSRKLRTIHNLYPRPPILFGADHPVSGVLWDIDRADRLAITTGDRQRQNMGHALSLIFDDTLRLYDIGELTVDDLEVAA